MYDVLVAGAGPAGATAAALLAAQGQSVLLIEKDALPRQADRTVWVNTAVGPLVEAVGLDSNAVLTAPFSDVTFYDGALKQSACPKLAQPAGYILQRAGFQNALVQAATKAGAELISDAPVTEVKLVEDGARLTTRDDRTFAGRVLLLAVGQHSPLIAGVLPGQSEKPSQRHIAQVASHDSDAKETTLAVKVILGLDGSEGFGLLIQQGQSLCVAATASAPADQVGRMLVGLCGDLASQGVISIDLTAQARNTPVRNLCANTALEMDSHVGKHCLVLGDSGGFVAAGSDQGIYPAMWSAQIAAEVVGEALASTHSQDVLMQFDAKWRIAMAQYLRPANTDLQFLLPLIFSNQPMADRMAGAFFAGENI